MSDILVRGMKSSTVQKLKARAKRNHRSLQSEAKQILENAAGYSMEEFLAGAAELRKKLGADGRVVSDSVELLREDRER